MSPDRNARRDQILEQALSLDSGSVPEFLDQECAGDSELRGELERLLLVNDQMPTWSLQSPAAVDLGPRFEAGQWLGRYELLGIQGSGGMGIVYRARDSVIGRIVALKVLTGVGRNAHDLSDRFLSELRILGGIVHDHVVRVYDYGEAEGWPYIVMELLEGEDLAHAIADDHCGGIDRKLEIARQIAAALRHVHAGGIVHYDLKPANVFLEASGRVKLMDFGIARTETLPRAATGGTPHYMAPERLRGQMGGPSADVYSFGILLFELLAGHRPFSANTPEELYTKVLSEPLPVDDLVAAQVPEHIRELVRRAASKDPAERPKDLKEVLAILNRIPAPKSRYALLAALMALVCVGAIAAWWLRPPDRRVGNEAPAPLVLNATKPEPAMKGSEPTRDDRELAKRQPSPRPAPETRAPAREPSSTGPPQAAPTQVPPAQVTPPQAAPVPVPELGSTAAQQTRPTPPERPPDVVAWEQTRDAAEAHLYEDFLRKYPGSAFAPEAQRRAEKLEWERIPKGADSAALRRFAEKYPGGVFAPEAARLAGEMEARRKARAEIVALLERYAAAYRSKNIQEIGALWPGLGPNRLRTIENSFANAESIEFELQPQAEPELAEGAYASPDFNGSAVVVCRWRLRMRDRSGVQPEPQDSRRRIRLARIDSRWRITAIE